MNHPTQTFPSTKSPHKVGISCSLFRSNLILVAHVLRFQFSASWWRCVISLMLPLDPYISFGKILSSKSIGIFHW